MEPAQPTTVPPQAEAPPGRFARRTYLIDRGFQLKYSAMLGVVAAGISGLFGGMMFLAQGQARSGFNDYFLRFGMKMPDEVQLQLSEIDTTLWMLLAATVVLMAVALALFGVLITHRVAGPVHVMSHYVSVLAKGRYPMMRPLRKADELKGFFERFSQAVEALRQKDSGEADQLDEALAKLTPLAQGPEAQGAIEALKALRDRKRDATDRIEISKAPPPGPT
jgi:hypothetical protein